MEHHANIVPWQIVAEQTGAKIIKIPMTSDCEFDLAAFDALLTERTKIVALAQITNVTGSRQPIEAVIEKSTQGRNAIVVVDGAQGIVHEPVDVSTLGANYRILRAQNSMLQQELAYFTAN
ncbi:aminotransferase class V-fold PLP-dependent enzyme [Vibrio chagasii]|nr:aminotransferase class V-fold PLP-dependent enzyme [Vibrio chagasii]